MKRAWGFSILLVLILACTACAQPVQPTSSAGDFQFFTSAATAAPTSAPTVTPIQTATPVAPTPAPTQSAGYQITTDNYEYSDASFDLQASYPQLVSSTLPDTDAINTLIEDTALETINGSFGYEDDGSFTTVESTGIVTYSDADFISITFEEYYNNSMAAHPSSVFRTLNINLNDGSTVAMSDMIVPSDSLYQALQQAANAQLSAEFANEITLDIIRDGFDYSALYFTPDRVGFSLSVYHALGDHVELTLPYNAAEPHMTSNEIWDRFI